MGTCFQKRRQVNVLCDYRTLDPYYSNYMEIKASSCTIIENKTLLLAQRTPLLSIQTHLHWAHVCDTDFHLGSVAYGGYDVHARKTDKT